MIRTDQNSVITKITVGEDPEGVGLDPADRFAYVANAGSNSVTIIKITNSDPDNFAATVDKSTVGMAPSRGSESQDNSTITAPRRPVPVHITGGGE